MEPPALATQMRVGARGECWVTERWALLPVLGEALNGPRCERPSLATSPLTPLLPPTPPYPPPLCPSPCLAASSRNLPGALSCCGAHTATSRCMYDHCTLSWVGFAQGPLTTPAPSRLSMRASLRCLAPRPPAHGPPPLPRAASCCHRSPIPAPPPPPNPSASATPRPAKRTRARSQPRPRPTRRRAAPALHSRRRRPQHPPPPPGWARPRDPHPSPPPWAACGTMAAAPAALACAPAGPAPPGPLRPRSPRTGRAAAPPLWAPWPGCRRRGHRRFCTLRLARYGGGGSYPLPGACKFSVLPRGFPGASTPPPPGCGVLSSPGQPNVCPCLAWEEGRELGGGRTGVPAHLDASA